MRWEAHAVRRDCVRRVTVLVSFLLFLAMDGVGNKGLGEGRRNKEVCPGELVGMAYHAGGETLVLYISDARRGGLGGGLD